MFDFNKLLDKDVTNSAALMYARNVLYTDNIPCILFIYVWLSHGNQCIRCNNRIGNFERNTSEKWVNWWTVCKLLREKLIPVIFI